MVELSGLAVSETPSQRIVADASRATTVTDSRGRLIAIKVLNPVDLFRLTKLLGSSGATNQATLNLAMAACSVTAIDGDAITAPATEREVEALLMRLDFHGLEAIKNGLEQLAMTPAEAVEQAKN